MTDRFPNLFVVGAAKAGTTSLHHYLALHPQIYMSELKEPHYFADVQPSAKLRRRVPVVESTEDYVALFRGRKERYLGESSPSYLWDPNSAGRIKAVSPEAKILICLRDPVERAYSHYLADWREGEQDRTFLEALIADAKIENKAWCSRGHLYLELGLYSQQVRRYCAAFGHEQLKVIEFAKLAADPWATMAEVFSFLGLSPASRTDPNLESHNPYAAPRNRLVRWLIRSWVRQLGSRTLPPSARTRLRSALFTAQSKPELDTAARDWLASHYGSDLYELENLLGKRLDSLHSSLLGQ